MLHVCCHLVQLHSSMEHIAGKRHLKAKLACNYRCRVHCHEATPYVNKEEVEVVITECIKQYCSLTLKKKYANNVAKLLVYKKFNIVAYGDPCKTLFPISEYSKTLLIQFRFI